MTGQFYKNPPRVFRSIIFLGAENLWGGFFVLLGRKQSAIPTSGLRFALRGSAGHAFFLLAGNRLAFPKYSRPPLFNQTFGFAYTFGAAKREPNRRKKRGNLSRKRVSPFRLHRLPAHIPLGQRVGSPAHHKSFPKRLLANASLCQRK